MTALLASTLRLAIVMVVLLASLSWRDIAKITCILAFVALNLAIVAVIVEPAGFVWTAFSG